MTPSSHILTQDQAQQQNTIRLMHIYSHFDAHFLPIQIGGLLAFSKEVFPGIHSTNGRLDFMFEEEWTAEWSLSHLSEPFEKKNT